MENKLNQTITLSDGRQLGYAEVGDLEGKPVFHFHGWPSSRLETVPLNDMAKKHGVRLIGIDRPGIGLSDFKPKRKILDWPDDVLDLANRLAINQFYVEGVSGGGPYALVCAYKIPHDRLLSCGVVCGMGPHEFGKKGMLRSLRLLFFVIRIPLLSKFLIWLLYGRKAKDFESTKRLLLDSLKDLPEVDQKYMNDPEILDPLIKATQESLRQGVKGLVHDCKLYTKKWNFKLEDISEKISIHLWHGELDENAPIRMVKPMCERIPNCKGHFFPSEGHFSLNIKYSEENLATITK